MCFWPFKRFIYVGSIDGRDGLVAPLSAGKGTTTATTQEKRLLQQIWNQHAYFSQTAILHSAAQQIFLCVSKILKKKIYKDQGLTNSFGLAESEQNWDSGKCHSVALPFVGITVLLLVLCYASIFQMQNRDVTSQYYETS